MSFGTGGRIEGFDFSRVEKNLTEVLLATCSPLSLQCAQFAYAGEVRKSGGLRKLGTKIPQINLTEEVIDQVQYLAFPSLLLGI